MIEPEYWVDCVFAPNLRTHQAALHRTLRAYRRERWQLVGMFQAGSGFVIMLFRRRRRGRTRRHITSRAA